MGWDSIDSIEDSIVLSQHCISKFYDISRKAIFL